MNKEIGILGCGWLGLPLAKALIRDNYGVRGTTTTPRKMETLLEAGIRPFQISLTERGIIGDLNGFLEGVSTLIVNIPPNLRNGNKESYIDKIQHLTRAIEKNPLKDLIFISSTSVYGDIPGIVTEHSPPNPDTESGRQLLATEGIVKGLMNLNTAIVRFGGLIGPDRHPINHLAGRKDLANGDERINLIHLDDCIGLLKALLTTDYHNILINGVYPHHPTKKEYYTSEAIKRGLPPPTYLSAPDGKDHKIIKNTRNMDKIYPYRTTIIS